MGTKRSLSLLTCTLAIATLLFLTGILELAAAPDQHLHSPPGQARFSPEEILVKFKEIRPVADHGPSAERAVRASLTPQAHHALKQVGGYIKGIVPSIGVFCIQISPHLSVGEAIEILYRSGTVEYAEPNYEIQLQAVPNDPNFGDQWGLHNTGQSGGTTDADIDAPAAWNVHKSAGAVVVAVIDSGVDYNHEDLADNMWQNPGEIPGNGTDDDGNGYTDDIYGMDAYNNDGDPMDTNGHGTHVAGIIAAKGNNGKGISGVAWNGKLMALRCGASEYIQVNAAVTCINYALAIKQREGYKMILNLSWATPYYSQSLYDALDAARAAGVLVVASTNTANYIADHDLYPQYPACFDLPNIISVGPSDRSDNADYYSYGTSSVDLHAPGKDIMSTLPSNTYGTKSGASMSCAHVSGAAAIIWSHRSSSNWKMIKGLILNGVENGKVSGAFRGKSVTEGRLNLYQSLADDLLDDPAIFSVTPNKAWVGDTITLVGYGFGATAGTLRFSGEDFPAPYIVSWSNTQIVATMPTGIPKTAGRIQVITAGGTSRGAYFAHGKVEALVGHTLIARYYAASAQVSDTVWILGGLASWGVTGLVERYNLADNRATMDSLWTMPTAVQRARAAAIGSKIYVVGGYDSNVNLLATLQIFDTTTKTWSTGPDAPVPFAGPAVVSYDGKLYVFGGAFGGESTFAYAYDPNANSWSPLTSMPQGTIYAAAAPVGSTGKIVVMGGGYCGGESSVVQVYGVPSNSWSQWPNMKKPRSGPAAINYGTKVFCLHGSALNGDYLADSEYYYSGTWRNTIFGSQELYMPLPGRLGDKIFSLCGYDQSLQYSNNVWRFTSP